MYLYFFITFWCLLPFKCDPIYFPNEAPTKPPMRQEPLNWQHRPSDTVDQTVITGIGKAQKPQQKATVQNQANPLEKNPVVVVPWSYNVDTTDEGTNSNSQNVAWPEENQIEIDLIWDGLGCPKGQTGQFPYLYDCRKFYNCWKGKGMSMVCAPGTLFNPKTLECDFPAKVTCLIPPNHYVVEHAPTAAYNASKNSSGTDSLRRHRHHSHHHQTHQYHYPEYYAPESPNNPHIVPGARRFDAEIPDEPITMEQQHHHAGVQPPSSFNYSVHIFPSNSSQGRYHTTDPKSPARSYPASFNYPSSSFQSGPKSPARPYPAAASYPVPSLPPDPKSPARPYPPGPSYPPRLPPDPKSPARPYPSGPSYPGPSLPTGPKTPANPYPAAPSFPPPLPSDPKSPARPYPSGPSYPPHSLPSGPKSPASPYPAGPSYPTLLSPANPKFPGTPYPARSIYSSQPPSPATNSSFWPSDLRPPSPVTPLGRGTPVDSYGRPVTVAYPTQRFDTSTPAASALPEPKNRTGVTVIISRFGETIISNREGDWKPVPIRTTDTDKRVAVTHRPSLKCPPGAIGMYPHLECDKFLSCIHGRTFVLNCSHGTRFHLKRGTCYHASGVECGEDGRHIIDTDLEDDLAARASESIQEVEVDLNTNGTGRAPSTNFSGGGRRHQSVDFKTTTTQPYITHPYYKDVKGFFIESDKRPNASHSKGKLSEPARPQATPSTTPKPLQLLKPTPTTKSEFTSRTTAKTQGTTTTTPSTMDSHVFRPEDTRLVEGEVRTGGRALHDRQVLRLRGGPTHREGFVEIQMAPTYWGVLCDRPNQWTIQEANIVCRHLGFDRGAELSWQGNSIENPASFSRIVSTDSVNCYGHEESILNCDISKGKVCELEKDAVWVRCYSNPVSRCMPGETSFEGNCYSLVVPKEDSVTELVGFSQGEALAHCQNLGGHLLDITSQRESDYISEWLVKQNFVESIMTSGVGVSVMGHALWIWEGSTDSFAYQNWWPGWGGGKGVAPKTESGRGLCVVARRQYPCAGSTANRTGEPKYCDAEYYYWDTEDCGAMSHQYPYVCERPVDDIGCMIGNGAHYKDKANVTKKGTYCIPWGTREVLSALRYSISESELRNKLLGHNYCRNVGGRDLEPWCYTMLETGMSKELCDIPRCSTGIEKSGQFLNYKCKVNEFSCNFNQECIPSVWVCNGQPDCTNGRDETECSSVMDRFSKTSKSRLIGYDIERYIQTPLMACAHHCIMARDFECKSFSYANKTQECVLSDSNIGFSGTLALNESGWDYFEMNSKSLDCDGMFVCKNGKCINKTSECNGHNDCGDRSDEKNCTWMDLGIDLKLTGGNKPNEGIVEIKVLGEWGLICDDQFDLRDAHVLCRHMGYNQGAAEERKHSDFNAKFPENTKYFVDDLNCRGNETNITQCEHNGWGIHDCGPEEAAGIVCKEEEIECGEREWQCDSGEECIPIDFLCDNQYDCEDRSDEEDSRCKSPLEMRLVGPGRSDKAYEGRLEVRRFGVWGTVCDDDFGENEADVVCKFLGYPGPAKALKEAAFGAGEGVIWLDQVHCAGNESNLVNCYHEAWASTNCQHNEDVSVICAPAHHQGGLKKGHHSKKVPTKLEIDDILPKVCGVPPKIDVSPHFTPKVVSGFETQKGSYPWQASIRVKSVSGRSSHWCGAVVISKLHVLTAGHCLRDYIKSSYYIRAGDFDTQLDEDTEQDAEIEEIWIHEDIDNGTRLNNDIALVKLKAPGFMFDRWVAPACLPRKRIEYTPGKNCSISGWGSNGGPGSGFARTLHATWLSIIPTDVCSSKYVYGEKAVTQGMFCAGSLTGGSDSCQGDSGGPFLCLHEGYYTLFGITSWGHGCGRANSPGVYTKLANYIDWVYEKILKSMAILS